MKFKVGDKVKILPSAYDIAVAKDEIGKITRIISISSEHSIVVESGKRYRSPWHVGKDDISFAVEKYDQLLLWPGLLDKE